MNKTHLYLCKISPHKKTVQHESIPTLPANRSPPISQFLFSQNFQTRGIGGGGALFSPSINPNNGQENYLASDLGGLYHTTNTNYDVVHFTEAITGQFSKVCFTQDDNLRYSCFTTTELHHPPAKSTDGGQTWNFLPGDDHPSEDKLFIVNDFQNTNRLIWTEYNNLYFSNDGGQTASLKWSAADPGTGILLSGAFFEGENIWLGTNEGVLFSGNGGTSFSLANFTGIPNDEVIIGFGGGKSGGLTRFFALTGDPGNVWASSMGFNYWETIRACTRWKTPAETGLPRPTALTSPTILPCGWPWPTTTPTPATSLAVRPMKQPLC
ncbi:MAG: hypothetical protein IPM82_18055 [Saprospiraceae bacterium]|nr:hypothetical protein [Saprospiraceae bacterium]